DVTVAKHRHPHRPEILVLRLVELGEAHPVIGGVELQRDVVIRTFCSSRVRRPRLSMTASAMRNSIGNYLLIPSRRSADPQNSVTFMPRAEGKYMSWARVSAPGIVHSFVLII